MQNVIHGVMEAEKEARRILQEARMEAELLIGAARQQAKANEEQARIDVRRTADTLIEDSVKAAENKKAAQLARAGYAMDTGVHIGGPVRISAVNAVVECVAGKSRFD